MNWVCLTIKILNISHLIEVNLFQDVSLSKQSNTCHKFWHPCDSFGVRSLNRLISTEYLQILRLTGHIQTLISDLFDAFRSKKAASSNFWERTSASCFSTTNLLSVSNLAFFSNMAQLCLSFCLDLLRY